MSLKETKRIRRHKRIRARVTGIAARPRLCVFRSGNHIYAQLIDDAKAKTLVSASSLKMKGKKNKTEEAKEVGMTIAKFALEKKIEKVVFDRGGFQYHGRIKALADGAREGGLKF
jgi:large subunit ribosomal protein L18